MPLLQTKGLGIRFGGLQALQDVNLTVNKGEIVGLIGPNGAGKTTVFNLLTEVYAPTEGTIELEGESLVGETPVPSRRCKPARAAICLSIVGHDHQVYALLFQGNLPHLERSTNTRDS